MLGDNVVLKIKSMRQYISFQIMECLVSPERTEKASFKKDESEDDVEFIRVRILSNLFYGYKIICVLLCVIA